MIYLKIFSGFSENTFEALDALVDGPVLTEYYKRKITDSAIEDLERKIGLQVPKGEALLRTIFDSIIPQIIKSFTNIFETLPFFDHLKPLKELNVDIAIAMITPPDPELARIFEQNTQDYTHLKKTLVEQNFAKAATFNIRSEKVFKWCSAVIPYIVHGPLSAIWQHPEKEVKLNLLKKASTKLAVFDTKIDDIADNIQDLQLTEWFCHICTSDDKAIEKLRLKIRKYQNGIYLDFFNSTVLLWRDIQNDLKTLFEVKDLKKTGVFDQRFKDHMGQLMDAMRYSVRMNDKKKIPSDFLTMEDKLSSNMMVQLLFDFQIELLKKSDMLPKTTPFTSKFQKMTKTIEKMFHHANSYATFEREMMEMDSTNPLFKLADDIFIALYRAWEQTNPGQTFSQYIQIHFEVSKSIDADSFIDLIVPRDRQQQFLIMKEVEDWYFEKGLITESVILKSGNYLDAQAQLLTISESIKFKEKKTPKIEANLKKIQEFSDQNHIRIQLVNDMIMKKDVMGEYFLHWMQLYRELDDVIKELQSMLSKADPTTPMLEKALGQYQINSMLFLINYLVYSRVKGSV